MKKYFTLIRAGIIDQLQFRLSMFISIVINMLYLLFTFFLWKAIFRATTDNMINGMTFEDTMIYLVFASALFRFIEIWIVWNMGRDIQSGQIVVDLLKPMDYRKYRFFDSLGVVIVNFFVTFLPTTLVVYFVSNGAITLSWNIPLFIVSIIMGMLINYYINFSTGVICMYTESIWGVNIFKEVMVSLLCGAVVPLAFFPDGIRDIVLLLPFQAICNAPMELLLHPEYDIRHIVGILSLQVFWLFALDLASHAFFKISVRKITVNGG